MDELSLEQWVDAARSTTPHGWSVTHHQELGHDTFLFVPLPPTDVRPIAVFVGRDQRKKIKTGEAARSFFRGKLLLAGAPVSEPISEPTASDREAFDSLVRALADGGEGGCPACWTDDTDDRDAALAGLTSGPRGVVDHYTNGRAAFPDGWETFWQILGPSSAPEYLRLIAVGPGASKVLVADVPWDGAVRMMPAYWARMSLSVHAETVFG